MADDRDDRLKRARDELRSIVTGMLKDADAALMATIADEAGVTVPLVYHWKSGERLPAMDCLSVLLRRFSDARETTERALTLAGVDLALLDAGEAA